LSSTLVSSLISLCAIPSCASRNHHGSSGQNLTAHFEAELRVHSSEAWISGHERLIPQMTNDEKDRHVAAAAVHGGAPIILTCNLRHFTPDHLKPWGLVALHPQSFLIEIFRQESALVVEKLEQQAADRNRSLRQLLNILNATVPDFVSLVSEATTT